MVKNSAKWQQDTYISYQLSSLTHTAAQQEGQTNKQKQTNKSMFTINKQGR